MERYAWKGYIKDGCLSEYKRRHDEIWPVMKDALKDAGVCNYSIWTNGHDLFGCYECEKGVAYAKASQAANPVIKKWQQFMSDIITLDATASLSEVFRLE